MTRDQALLDYFKSLRVAFKDAAMYTADHPAFIACVEDLKNRVETAFQWWTPLSLGFSPRSVFADGRFWEGEKTFRDLGMQFHVRKIKSLEIRPGISIDELMRFAVRLTMPISDFVKAGGAKEILKKERIIHIAVEELDYKQLLDGEGEEIKDVWPYLLQEAVEQDDAGKIIEMAESFDRVVDHLDASEMVVDENMGRNFTRFFAYLKDNATSKYRSCAKGLIKSFVTRKDVTLQTKFDNIKAVIADLKEEDMASTLWEEIISDDGFDSLSFSIFSKLLESDRHRKVSVSLKNLFQTENPLNRRPEVEDKIKALLSGTSGRFISEIYRQTLDSLLKEIHFDRRIVFDHALLASNYRYILLNILAHGTEPERAASLLDRILGTWDEIAGFRDFEFLACLQEILLEKRSSVAEAPALQKITEALGESVERAVLEEEHSPFFDRIISGLAESRLGIDAYLEKIFAFGKITPTILRAYYRFFKEDLGRLTSRLKERGHDRPFLERMIDASKTIDSSLSLEILKSIYAAGDLAVQQEAIQAMGCLSEIDKDFLFAALRSREPALKGRALALLAGRESTRKRALDRFLRFQSPYGIRNKKLRTHIRIVEEMNLREASGHLERLCRRKSSWNRSVRREARRVLDKWNESRN
jgi:hypothetical protein